MKTVSIPVAAIRVRDRRRAVNPYIVEDLRQSIQQSGLLQNIGVVQEPELWKNPDGSALTTYRLVFGAHRLEAVTELEWTEVPALVFPEGTSDEECLLAEIQENMSRNELTGAERKAFAAEVGRISTVLFEKSGNKDQSGSDSDWFSDWRNKAGLPKNTGYDWWASFCKDAGLKLTPKQADMATRLWFFRWLDEQKANDDADKARKEEEKAAEKARKEEEKALTKRNEAFAALLQSLLFLQGEYGFDAVMDGVIQPFLDNKEAEQAAQS